jgi:hypothetical protein
MSEVTYDVVVVCEKPAMRLAPHGIKMLIQHLVAQNCLTRTRTQRREGGVAHVGGPGAFARVIFEHGGASPEGPVFSEAAILEGQKPMDLGYPGLDPVYFAIEFKGVCFSKVSAGFLQRVDQILRCRPRMFSREQTKT